MSDAPFSKDENGNFKVNLIRTDKPLDVHLIPPNKDNSDQLPLCNSTSFVLQASEDYHILRILYHTVSPLLTFSCYYHGTACLEKIMKAYLVKNNLIDISKYEHKTHDLEKLRQKCAKHNTLFNDSQFVSFSQVCSQADANQLFRYGMEKHGCCSMNLQSLIDLVDKMFIKTVIMLGENIVSIVFGSILHLDVPKDADKIIPKETFMFLNACVSYNNVYFPEVVSVFNTAVEQGRIRVYRTPPAT